LFDALAQRFTRIFQSIGGTGRLTDKGIEDAVREVRKALLEADVNLRVIDGFVERVREKAVGLERLKGVAPADQFVKVVHDELVGLLGGQPPRMRWSDRGPTVIMLVGLQGTGKTTTCAKIARHLKKKEGKRPLMVAADVQRPAAVEQLKLLGQQIDVPVYAEEGGRPPKICHRGVQKAAELSCDVVLLDTAGRLHVDTELMDELSDVRDKVQPHEIWLAVDAMLGQDAVTSAKEFDRRLAVTGLVLTKADGDARGGAVLAVREVTGKPVRYVGVGEKLDRIEAFDPERMAGRILGMGDVVGLVEEAQEAVDQKQAQQAAERLYMDRFTLDDLAFMLDGLRRMGGMKGMLKKLPGAAALPTDQVGALDDDLLKKWMAAISSMTPAERRDPRLLHMQRRNRVARGAGTPLSVVNDVVKAHKQMKPALKQAESMGLMGRMAAHAFKKQKGKRLKDMKKRGVDISGWFDT
jgi:signal recognition particle subunit SRP54